jgi:serine protease Do
MEVEGLKADPVHFADEKTLKLGSFLALSRPDGEAAAMGVVSVLPRSLRSSDRAFLGIVMDLEFEGPGVLVRRVEPGTGAAASGLRADDVILRVMDQKVNGSFELGTVLQRLEPGQKIEIVFQRGEKQEVINVELGGRPRAPRIPYSRMEQMNSMGGHRYSDVKDGFRDVIQSDMQLDPEDCGAPVIDLDGRAVGIAIARAGRIKSFVIPASGIKRLLAMEPAKPQLQSEDLGERKRNREVEPGDEDPFELMRRKMEEMRRLMEEIEEKDK